jgi:hypothetical protein
MDGLPCEEEGVIQDRVSFHPELKAQYRFGKAIVKYELRFRLILTLKREAVRREGSM